MKKGIIVLTFFMVIGLAGCGCDCDPEEIQEIRSNTDSLCIDVENMSTEMTEIHDAVEKIESSNSNQNDAKEYKKQIKTLQEKIDKLTEEKETIENSKTPKYQDYIDAVFPKDGTYVLREGDEVQFYSDVTCTKEIKTPKFSSSVVNEKATAKNGLNPYSLRTTDNEIVYCTSRPSLVNEAEQ